VKEREKDKIAACVKKFPPYRDALLRGSAGDEEHYSNNGKAQHCLVT
jgi:hypothetical protein